MSIVITQPTTLHVTDARGRSTRSELSYNSDMPSTAPYTSSNAHAPKLARYPSLQLVWLQNHERWDHGLVRAKEKAAQWTNHVASHPISQKPINSITYNEAQAFVAQLALGPDGQRKLVQVIRRCTATAIREGWLRYCPFDKHEIRLAKPDKGKEIKAYSRDELERLHAVCDDDQEEFFFGCLHFAMMRKADARLLEWQDIDFGKNQILFPAHKTKKRQTERIVMVPRTRDLLERRWIRKGKPSTGYVFANEKGSKYAGKPYGRNYRFGLDKLIEKANVPKIPGRDFHGFRHSGAVAAASGDWGRKWSIEEVAKMLRDKSMKAAMVYFDIHDEAMLALASEVISPYPKGDGVISRRTNPSESPLKLGGATRHGTPLFGSSLTLR